MPPDPTVAEGAPRAKAPARRGIAAGIVLGLAVALLATIETAQALIAPARAPTAADWQAAAVEVHAGLKPGDLIVAAPPWADPQVRLVLGDVISIPMAARMDDARYGRVWEVAVHGAHADEARGTTTREKRFGAVSVRLVERPAAVVTYDFLEHWNEARVWRWDPAARTSTPCPWQGERFACPGGGTVHRELVEVDTRIRRALLAPPVTGAILALEFPAVPLGRELVLAAGLHDVWARKYATGTVDVQLWIDGQPVRDASIGNRSGWAPITVDTSALAGQTRAVRVQIASAQPNLRHLAFAAEARR
ncbi:MAG TPA: hypothetical protein VHU40_15100 [Polyangia bacterium]|nr:hypothetical protein [Polyangia bacterium]